MSVQSFPYTDALQVPIYEVDAFTDRSFYGNPAAVCLLTPETVLTDEEMQKIGAEMNLSETAFITSEKGDFVSGAAFGLRWFTPTHEVDLCGHATLASSAVLFYAKGNRNEEVTFSSRSGPLKVKRDGARISLNFPRNDPSPKNSEEVQKLLEVCVMDLSLIQDVQLSKTGKLLVRLVDSMSRETFESLTPQVGRMIESEPSKVVKGVGLTLKGSQSNGCVDKDGKVYDFVSRYFGPWLGINEDPVTGAWHTVATPYWSDQLGKSDLYARQCSARGGDLWLTLDNDRVILSGHAVINLQGTLSVKK